MTTVDTKVFVQLADASRLASERINANQERPGDRETVLSYLQVLYQEGYRNFDDFCSLVRHWSQTPEQIAATIPLVIEEDVL